MRQAGILAAAGLYALDHNVERLAEDHANARRLAEGLAELPGVDIDLARVETNIVVFGVPDAFGAVRRALRARACSSRRSARSGCARSRTWTSTRTASTRRSTVFRRLLSSLKRAAHELGREEQDQAGEADLQRALRDVVGDHRAAHHARAATGCRSRARRGGARCRSRTGATRRRARPSMIATSDVASASIWDWSRKIASAGTNRMPPPTPIRPRDARRRGSPSTIAASSFTRSAA